MTALTLIAATAMVTACQRKQAAQKPRTEITSLDARRAALLARSMPEFSSPLETASLSDVSSCARLNDLTKLNGAETYSFIHDLKDGFVGGVSVDQSPFTQMFLAEQFKVPGDDEFVAMAKDKYDKGELSAKEYYGLLAIRKMPGDMFEKTKLKQVNKALEEALPGVFGRSVSMAKSLFLSLAAKEAPVDNTPTDWAVLAKTTPLFVSNDWNEFSADVNASLAVSVHASYSSDRNERLCALVLWQRTFNQLLAIKGYKQAKFTKNAQSSQVDPLGSGAKGFATQDRPGAFVDTSTGERVILSQQQLAAYEPAKSALILPSSLKNSMGMLEALATIFEATSPASPWVKDAKNYLLGKIDDPKSPAILPAEVHGLALGLIGIQFKNLAAMNLIKINAKGTKLKDGESAAGMLVAEMTANPPVVSVRLENVLSLTRAIITLDNALSRLAKADPASLKALNPLYDDKTLAGLTGKEGLHDNLVQLQLPMAFAILEMGLNSGKCIAAVDYNVLTGEKKPTEQCSAELQSEFRQTLQSLALYTRSPILLKRLDAPSGAR